MLNSHFLKVTALHHSKLSIFAVAVAPQPMFEGQTMLHITKPRLWWSHHFFNTESKTVRYHADVFKLVWLSSETLFWQSSHHRVPIDPQNQHRQPRTPQWWGNAKHYMPLHAKCIKCELFSGNTCLGLRLKGWVLPTRLRMFGDNYLGEN